ncbi:hypothetical protein CASFOL_031536 [Castilleja foliolosa]|uniref:Uncharacterized protein n=1 Tax=Castilleja foliolosa TaxID=1961234 RepID=A0ABD3C500_9LAMI
MALFAKQFSLFLLFVSLLSSQARESQFFNKASVTTINDVVPQPESSPQQDQPEFLPDTQNGHGLYGHESGRLPPSTTTYKTEPNQARPINKYLPKNYNPVAYITEPDNINESPATFSDDNMKFTDNKNNFYGGAQNYYSTPQEKEPEYRDNFYNGGNSFNSGGAGALGSSKITFDNGAAALGSSENTFNNGGAALGRQENAFDNGPGDLGRRENTFDNGGAGANALFEQQGMSDTRWIENGKYHYDVEADKYNDNHPYERLKRPGVGTEYGINGGENAMGGYQNQKYEFQGEENSNLRP